MDIKIECSAGIRITRIKRISRREKEGEGERKGRRRERRETDGQGGTRMGGKGGEG